MSALHDSGFDEAEAAHDRFRASIAMPIIVDAPLKREQIAAALASAFSLKAALIALNGLAEGVAHRVNGLLPNFPMLLDDVGDLFRVEPIDPAAIGASKLQGFEILPGDRYFEFVTAFVAHRHSYTVRVLHGWPILSTGDRTPVVAGAAGESIPGGEGRAA